MERTSALAIEGFRMLKAADKPDALSRCIANELPESITKMIDMACDDMNTARVAAEIDSHDPSLSDDERKVLVATYPPMDKVEAFRALLKDPSILAMASTLGLTFMAQKGLTTEDWLGQAKRLSDKVGGGGGGTRN